MGLRKRVWLTVFGLLMAVAVFGETSVKVVAHRAHWRSAPENSILAIENAIALGCEMVELDVRRTKDGVLVLMHDAYINRTTTGFGRVDKKTMKQLSRLYLRDHEWKRTEHRIPTFKEAMLACKGKIMVNVDKAFDYFDEVYAILEETDTVEQCLIKSSKPYSQLVKESGDIINKVKYMTIIDALKPNAWEIYNEYKENFDCYAYEIIFSQYNEKVQALVDDIDASGNVVWVNTLWPSICGGMNDEKAVLQGKQKETWGFITQTMHAKWIQTDRPEELIQFLSKENQ